MEYYNDYLNSCEAVANFVNAKKENIVLLRNTTTGINAVIMSLGFKVRLKIFNRDYVVQLILKH